MPAFVSENDNKEDVSSENTTTEEAEYGCDDDCKCCCCYGTWCGSCGCTMCYYCNDFDEEE